MVRVWSMATRISIAGGMSALSWGSLARMRSTVSMILAPGWRKSMTSTEGLPLA